MELTLFHEELCDACGECMERCPVLEMDPVLSSRAVERLAAGERVPEVLDRCTGCMSCDALCEKGAGPYGLLLDHYSGRYDRQGIPGVFLGAMPQRQGPNLWRSLQRWLSADEKLSLTRWSRPPGASEILFLGCNQRLNPYIAMSPLLSRAHIFTDPDECCGEFYLRLGLLEKARRSAASLAARFSSLGIERVIAFCPACQNTMRRLAPLYLGVEFNVEVVGLVDWLSGLLEGGELELRRLPLTATVQDPCHASGLGDDTVAGARTLLESMGLAVREMEHHGELAECCGLGASIARYRLSDVMRTGFRRIRQTHRSGADVTCAWCHGCYLVMNMFRLLYPMAPPVYHLVELLEMSAGCARPRGTVRHAARLLSSAVEATARDRFSFRPAGVQVP